MEMGGTRQSAHQNRVLAVDPDRAAQVAVAQHAAAGRIADHRRQQQPLGAALDRRRQPAQPDVEHVDMIQ